MLQWTYCCHISGLNFAKKKKKCHEDSPEDFCPLSGDYGTVNVFRMLCGIKFSVVQML